MKRKVIKTTSKARIAEAIAETKDLATIASGRGRLVAYQLLLIFGRMLRRLPAERDSLWNLIQMGDQPGDEHHG